MSQPAGTVPPDGTQPAAGADAAAAATAAAAPGAVPEPRAQPHIGDDVIDPASDALLGELLQRLRTVMEADGASVLVVDPDAGVLRPVLSHGVGREAVLASPVALGEGFAGRIAATAAPVRHDDVTLLSDPTLELRDAGVRSVIGAPLVVDGAVVGVLHLASTVPGRFGEADEALLVDAAERAAWALDHGLLTAAARRARESAASTGERLRRLQAISLGLVGDLTVQDVVDTVVRDGLSLLEATAGAVWELPEDSDALVLRGVVGYPDEVLERWRTIPLATSAPATDAARDGQTVVLQSVADRDARYPHLAGRASVGEAFVCAALSVSGRVIGVLGLGFSDAATLRDDEAQAFLDAAVALCSGALHRALVLEQREASLQEANRNAQRLAALQRVTAALADARGAEDLLDVIVADVTAEIGAVRIVLAELGEDGASMDLVRAYGLDRQLRDKYSSFPVVPEMPAADALLQRRAIVLRTVEERDRRYPAIATPSDEPHALVCLPLVVGDRSIGAVALSFPGAPRLDDADVAFLQALADQCAHGIERARLVDAQARARRRLELLAEAGRIFAAPLDVELTSLQFARLVVGRICDGVVVHLFDAQHRLSLTVAEHVETAKVAALRALMAAAGPADASYDAVVTGGEPLLWSDPDQVAAALAGDDADRRALLDRVRPGFGVVLPLVAGGRVLGALTVLGSRGAAATGREDVDALTELAGRLAVALDGARLLRQQIEISHTLQRSLLPSSLPQVPGAEVAVRYLPGAEGVEVGGDFYDVIPLRSGRVGLVVGDVMGRGVRAAAMMGQLRAAIRGYCLDGHGPAALLERLDGLVATLEDGLLVTALYAEWDPQARTVLCSTAGHLPPLMRLGDRPPTYLEMDPGVPLGVGMPTYAEVELTLPPGSLLLFFTDGLVEGPDLPVEDGMARLAGAVADADGAMEICEAALAALRPRAGSRAYDDDTALLALVTDGGEPRREPGEQRSVELAPTAASAGAARAFVAAALDDWGLAPLRDVAVLLTSELVTNSVRHARTGMRVTLTLRPTGQLRVAVTDRGFAALLVSRPSTSEAEGGRGLFLVEQLSEGWGSLTDDAGTTVWFELAP